MPDKDHPLWPLLRQLVTVGTLGALLYFNYNSFDHRDLVTMFVVAAAGGGVEVAGRLLGRK